VHRRVVVPWTLLATMDCLRALCNKLLISKEKKKRDEENELLHFTIWSSPRTTWQAMSIPSLTSNPTAFAFPYQGSLLNVLYKILSLLSTTTETRFL